MNWILNKDLSADISEQKSMPKIHILGEIVNIWGCKENQRHMNLQRFCAVLASRIRSSFAFFLNCGTLLSVSSLTSFFTGRENEKKKKIICNASHWI